jgi:integrase/recombinase XerC
MFLAYLRYEKNRSEQTVRRYGSALRDFEAFFLSLDEGLEWASVDADIIRRWMESLMDRGDIASTVNTSLSAIRSFFKFALSRGLIEKDPARMVAGPKKSKPLPVFVRENTMDQLIDHEEWDESDFYSVRARTIIILLYEAGLRRSELAGLDDNDVDMDTRQLKVTGKRDKQRIVPFGEELARQLRQYVELRDKTMPRLDSALFVGNNGRRITGSKVYTIVKENLTKVTSLKKRSPHVLRHSYATAMLNHGAGLESVKQLLGHESLDTTQVYTHTTFEQLKRVYKEAHPRG